jgi:hypothetical protein
MCITAPYSAVKWCFTLSRQDGTATQSIDPPRPDRALPVHTPRQRLPALFLLDLLGRFRLDVSRRLRREVRRLVFREAGVAASLHGVLTVDARKRREKAEQKRADMPPEMIKAHNLCVSMLAELEPQAALEVVTRIGRSLRGYLATRARSGF